MKRIFAAIAAMLIVSSAFAVDARNNIVILLDTSGSMEEQMVTVRQSKWNAAKQSLVSVVDQIPDGTNIGLLMFDPEDWKYDLGPVNRQVLIDAIQNASITPRSGTPLGTYIKKAADRLLLEREKSFGYGTYKLLIVTDGDPTNEPDNLVDMYLPDVLSRGITVECIGVSMTRDSILKNKVHKYMSADDTESLTRQIVSSVQAEVSMDDGFGSFEELEGISDDIAEVIISTLSTTGNHPIGEQPPLVFQSTTGEDKIKQQSNPKQEQSVATFLVKAIIVIMILLLIVSILMMILHLSF